MHYRPILMLSTTALLSLLAPAQAATSNPTDYNTANLSLTASGTAAQVVSFEIPSTNLEIDSKYIRPGSTFTVTIPVKNTTDRSIDVNVTPTASGEATASLAITGDGKATIAPNTSGDVVFTFTFAENMASDQAAQAMNVTFDVQATGTYDTSSGNQTF